MLIITQPTQLLVQIHHHSHYMFQPKRSSSGTRALTIPIFLPPAMPLYTGQCLHIGSVFNGCIVLVMPLILIYAIWYGLLYY
jgi:hypothetical protein